MKTFCAAIAAISLTTIVVSQAKAGTWLNNDWVDSISMFSDKAAGATGCEISGPGFAIFLAGQGFEPLVGQWFFKVGPHQDIRFPFHVLIDGQHFESAPWDEVLSDKALTIALQHGKTLDFSFHDWSDLRQVSIDIRALGEAMAECARRVPIT